MLVYTAYAGYLPEKKVGVAVLANARGYLMSHIGMYALSQLLGVDPETIPFIKSDKVLGKLQGEYETYMGTMKATVKKKGDLLGMSAFLGSQRKASKRCFYAKFWA